MLQGPHKLNLIKAHILTDFIICTYVCMCVYYVYSFYNVVQLHFPNIAAIAPIRIDYFAFVLSPFLSSGLENSPVANTCPLSSRVLGTVVFQSLRFGTSGSLSILPLPPRLSHTTGSHVSSDPFYFNQPISFNSSVFSWINLFSLFYDYIRCNSNIVILQMQCMC